jgi:hypothetical protein
MSGLQLKDLISELGDALPMTLTATATLRNDELTFDITLYRIAIRGTTGCGPTH